jgi:hypothetical protein
MLHLRNHTMNETRAYAPATWMRRATAAGILGLALTSPVALAQPDVYVNHRADNGATAAPTNLQSPDAQDAATRAQGAGSTDARHGAQVATGSLAGTTGGNAQAPASEPVNRVKADDGLDWGSAGIGAGAVTAVMLLGLAGTIGTRRSRVHPAN